MYDIIVSINKHLAEQGDFMEFNLKAEGCACGKQHLFKSRIIIGENAVNKLPEILESELYKAVYFSGPQHIRSGRKVRF